MAKKFLLAALLFAVSLASAEAADYRVQCPSQDVDRAIRGCTIAVGIGANLPIAYANRCVAFWLKGAYARASVDCDQAIQHGGKFAVAYLIRGIALAENGDHRAAIADYTRSLDVMATGSAYYNRGTAYLALNDYAAGLADFDKAIAADPRVPQAHINRALALLASGRTVEVRADLDRGLELLQGDPLASAIRKQVIAAVEREGPGRLNTPPGVPLYPPSKVLSKRISLELFAGTTLSEGSVASFRASPLALRLRSPSTPRQPKDVVRAPAAIRAATSRDSLSECLRLWHPETQTTQSQWKEICRRLDFPSHNTGAKPRR